MSDKIKVSFGIFKFSSDKFVRKIARQKIRNIKATLKTRIKMCVLTPYYETFDIYKVAHLVYEYFESRGFNTTLTESKLSGNPYPYKVTISL